MRFLATLLSLAIAGCAPAAAPPLNECSGSEWILAEGPVDRSEVSGISATLSSLDLEDQYLSCEPVDDFGGWASAAVNLAAYDRSTGVGGSLVQLGLSRSPVWDIPLVFWRTEDASGGGMLPLPAPYPEDGRAYHFSIEATADGWHFTIADVETGDLLHDLVEPATWSVAESAWVMLTAGGRGSRLGAWYAADAPRFSDVSVVVDGDLEAVELGGCYVRRALLEDSGWVVDDKVSGARCSAVNGSFSAFYDG